MSDSQKLKDLLKIDESVPVEDDNSVVWCLPGTSKNHRKFGPAVIYFDRRDRTKIISQEWWFNGVLHREDGPAVITENGIKEYYQNGKLHRLDGPAVVTEHGTLGYYQYGRLHRLDGPAKIKGNRSFYFIKGKLLREVEYNEITLRYERFVTYLKRLVQE